MAKKNYHRLENLFEPSVNTSTDRQVAMTFRCKNSKGTETDVNIRVEKYWLPVLIKAFTRIAKSDATSAEQFLQRIKESVNQ